MCERIFLWGMMGAGKSHQGKLLAKRINWDFIDLDQEIESKLGMSIPEIFQQNGEVHFRQIEQEMLRNLLGIKNLVVSTGGGTPCFFDNAKTMLDAGLCVYLEASPKFLESRLNQSEIKRPLLKEFELPEGRIRFLKNLQKKRDNFYKQAHIQMSAVNLNVQKMVEQIEPLL